jgi:hypothetical protein
MRNRLGFVDSLPPAKQQPPTCKALMTMIDNYNYIYIHKLMLNLKTNFFHYPLGATLGQRRLSWTTTICHWTKIEMSVRAAFFNQALF